MNYGYVIADDMYGHDPSLILEAVSEIKIIIGINESTEDFIFRESY